MSNFTGDLASHIQVAYATIGTLYIFLGIDDFILDIYAIAQSIYPKKMSPREFAHLNEIDEKYIAITVPTWKESGIISRMILGNIEAINYTNYHFFVGVYPNDHETYLEVKHLATQCSNVHLVLNTSAGPTTKAQMLNCMIAKVLSYDLDFVAIQMQDAEDLMHPFSLKLANLSLESADFIQSPVLSVKNKWSEFVGSSYMDEFAEAHGKDLLIRAKLGAAIPSAGVGTTISIKVIQQFKQWGIKLFNERSLTEDYELGIICNLAGFKSHFACQYIEGKYRHQRELISTREYFPNNIKTAIKQKSRWNIGIAMQAWKNLSWRGSLTNRYFLYRDRKGPISSLVVAAGYCLLTFVCVCMVCVDSQRSVSSSLIKGITSHPYLQILFAANLILMLNRFFQRHRFVHFVYGPRALPFVFLRIPIGAMINACAATMALSQFLLSSITGRRLIWDKTPHRLPKNFGRTELTTKKSG